MSAIRVEKGAMRNVKTRGKRRTYVPDKLDFDSIMRRALTVSNANRDLPLLSAQPNRRRQRQSKSKNVY